MNAAEARYIAENGERAWIVESRVEGEDWSECPGFPCETTEEAHRRAAHVKAECEECEVRVREVIANGSAWIAIEEAVAS